MERLEGEMEGEVEGEMEGKMEGEIEERGGGRAGYGGSEMEGDDLGRDHRKRLKPFIPPIRWRQ